MSPGAGAEERIRIVVKGLGEDSSILFSHESYGIYTAKDLDRFFKDACWVPGVVKVTFYLDVPQSVQERRRSEERSGA